MRSRHKASRLLKFSKDVRQRAQLLHMTNNYTLLSWLGGSVANLCGTLNRPLFLNSMSSLMHLIGGLSKLFDH